MIEPDERRQFESMVRTERAAGRETALAAAIRARPESSIQERRELAASMVAAAFTGPEQIAGCYDAAAAGWYGESVGGEPIAAVRLPMLPLGDAFWATFWGMIDNPGESAGEVTMRTAALGGLLAPEFQARAASACLAYPGVSDIDPARMPERIALSDLAACPEGSLGHRFHRLIVDNGFDLEVLDRDALGLATLRPPLNYLNTRMLQTHDLWHIVAGYRVTSLHEIAISAFQLSQFGHNYSAMFLALVVAMGAFRDAAGPDVIMETVMSAWRHGRRTPPMMLIPWEREWRKPAPEIREKYGVSVYETTIAPDLFEQLRGRAAPLEVAG